MSLAYRASTGDQPTVVVVGGGIIGLCAAWHLQRDGARVTLIERDEPGRSCSFGNAGAISSSSVAPLAMPGAALSAIGMLLDRNGPLYIPPLYAFVAASWLLRFVRASRRSEVERIATALSSLLKQSAQHHRRLVREIGASDLLQNGGQLHLYRNATQLNKDKASWDLRRQHGLIAETLDRSALLDLEPDLGSAYTTGIYIADQDTCVNPYRYSLTLAEDFTRIGGRIVQDEACDILLHDGVAVGARGSIETYISDHTVVCAGAWSSRLLSPLGYSVPLETQRGYHVDLTNPGVRPRRTVIAADRKIFITPMETGLRTAGTVEFGGLERPPSVRRAALLLRHLAEVYPAAQQVNASKYWMGNRPCLPDSLPVLGRSFRNRGLWFGFGHGHLGLTMSAVSGDLLARMVLGRPVDIAMEAYSIDRYATSFAR